MQRLEDLVDMVSKKKLVETENAPSIISFEGCCKNKNNKSNVTNCMYASEDTFNQTKCVLEGAETYQKNTQP